MDLRELQAEYRKVTPDKLVPGTLVLTELSTEDGLTLVDRESKIKRLVVIGVDRQRNICYGSLLVNTKPNPRARYSEEFLRAQFLLKREDYPDFLRYDSTLDCGELFSIPIQKLVAGQYYGSLKDSDKQAVWQILQSTTIHSSKQKNRYGIM